MIAMLAGCAGEVGETTPVGEAQATIKQVPAQVSCVELTVVGSRTVSRGFDVVAGQSSVLSLPNLPTGLVSFSGAAYGTACSAIGTATPSWLSDATPAVITAGSVTAVNLILRKSGSASVGVDFQDGDGGVSAPVDLAQPPFTPDGGVSPLVDLAQPPFDAGAALTISPPAFDFGPHMIGSLSQLATFTVTNVGAAPTGMIAVTQGGANPGEFAVAANGCGAPLTTFGTCTVSMQYRPTSAGSRSSLVFVGSPTTGAVAASLFGSAQ